MIDWDIGHYEQMALELGPVAEHVVSIAHLRRGERVVDLATGTGNAALLAAGAGARATGVDSAPRLIDVARNRAMSEGVDASFVVGDIQALPFDDGPVATRDGSGVGVSPVGSRHRSCPATMSPTARTPDQQRGHLDRVPKRLVDQPEVAQRGNRASETSYPSARPMVPGSVAMSENLFCPELRPPHPGPACSLVGLHSADAGACRSWRDQPHAGIGCSVRDAREREGPPIGGLPSFGVLAHTL